MLVWGFPNSFFCFRPDVVVVVCCVWDGVVDDTKQIVRLLNDQIGGKQNTKLPYLPDTMDRPRLHRKNERKNVMRKLRKLPRKYDRLFWPRWSVFGVSFTYTIRFCLKLIRE